MKKLFILSAVAALFAFSSCKKEYTCTCVDGLIGEPYTETAKGKDADEACADASSAIKLKVCVPAEDAE